MNSEVKAAWIEALRSGKYKQGLGQLRNHDDEFCCLGVLCDISGLGVWTKTRFSYQTPSDDQKWYLPSEVSNWAKIGETITLIGLNDGGKDFNHIASYIENNL